MTVDKVLVRVANSYCVYDGLNEDNSPKCAITTDSFNASYADALKRIDDMNNAERSGDIILIMKDSTVGNDSDRYTTAYACKAWHGSLNASDSYVPFIVSYPAGNKFETEKVLKKDDACKTDYSNCNANWKLPDIVKKIISDQY